MVEEKQPTAEGREKYDNGYYEGIPCICVSNCKYDCKGECGCRACSVACYGDDFLAEDRS